MFVARKTVVVGSTVVDSALPREVAVPLETLTVKLEYYPQIRRESGLSDCMEMMLSCTVPRNLTEV